jgi:RNA polymerase sigma factor (sigma-70 family)
MAALTKPARVVSGSLLRLQSDARLAELARDDHEAAFETLVQRYRPELVRASTRIVGPDRAEDAVQQALLNAHRAIDTTENVQNLRAWLHRIAQNSSLNILRAVRDEVPFENQPHVASAMAGPADSAELSERLNETLAAIDALPENQRAALLLRELEGRSHEDIAAALGVTTGAARQQLMRARQGVRSAVTVLTPYPLIASLANPGTGSGLAELIFGAGASATALKLGASVAATGAIAGGVFGASVGVKTSHTHESKAPTSHSVKQAAPGGPKLTGTTEDHGGRGSGTDDAGAGNSGRGSGKDDRSDDNSGPGSSADDHQRPNDNRGPDGGAALTVPGASSGPGPSGSSGSGSGSSGSSGVSGDDGTSGDD